MDGHASTDRLENNGTRRVLNYIYAMLMKGRDQQGRHQLDIAIGMTEPESMEVAPGVNIEAPSWWTDE